MQTTHRPTERLNTSSSADLYAIQSEEIERIWYEILPLVRKFLPYTDGKYTEVSIFDSLWTKKMQLWVAGKPIQAIAVTQITNYPAKQVCSVMFCAGENFKLWVHHLDEIGRWAKSIGCEAVEVIGRPGWQKVLGWELTDVLLRKTL